MLFELEDGLRHYSSSHLAFIQLNVTIKRDSIQESIFEPLLWEKAGLARECHVGSVSAGLPIRRWLNDESIETNWHNSYFLVDNSFDGSCLRWVGYCHPGNLTSAHLGYRNAAGGPSIVRYQGLRRLPRAECRRFCHRPFPGRPFRELG